MSLLLKSRQSIASLLIILGVTIMVLPTLGETIKGAIIIVDETPPVIISSTISNNALYPTNVISGADVNIILELHDWDEGSGIQEGDVMIASTSGDDYAVVGDLRQIYLDERTGWDNWGYSWSVPDVSQETKVRIDYLIKDKVWVEYSLATGQSSPSNIVFGMAQSPPMVGYAMILPIMGPLEGYFEVNGNKIDSTTQVLILNSETINVYFYATDSSGSVIETVLVNLYHESEIPVGGHSVELTEIVNNEVWSSDPYYTLTQDGVYYIEGLVTTSSHGSGSGPMETIQFMSIISVRKQGLSTDNITVLIGLVITSSGVIVLGTSKNMRKRK
jgi:hypothetical protein